MLYKRFRIRFQIRLRRKLNVVYLKTNYCYDCYNYILYNKGVASCALDLNTIKVCYREFTKWISSGKVGPKYLPDASKEIEDLK